MTYKVVLRHCDALTESSRAQAERSFGFALEHALGGAASVYQAHAAYVETISRYGGTPLPIDAPAWDRDIVDRWEDGVAAGREAAFVGWACAPSGAEFEVFTAASEAA
jgi:hypothetical protein